ncbi:extensin family protein [Novosphingobium sp. M1R2S20]|uniref:Extensin family protein n=1 Tax=Novosphingobium rhizovicinum TaxID=3228928 RepID=A0ABV3RBR0_9SPHN
MRFVLDYWLLAALLLLAVFAGGRAWLRDHPEHDPWSPLSPTDDPEGWATKSKIAGIRDDPAECRAFLQRSDIEFTPLDPTGAGACRREDRQVLAAEQDLGLVLRPSRPQATCAVGAGLARWLQHGVQPAAESLLGVRVEAIEHYGTNNCRRIGGGETGSWSEHATGNAIDIAAFVLEDGRRIVVRRDWAEGDAAAAFLQIARDTACHEFSTVLSPDYNAAHADHLHLDQAQRGGMGWTFCR